MRVCESCKVLKNGWFLFGAWYVDVFFIDMVLFLLGTWYFIVSVLFGTCLFVLRSRVLVFGACWFYCALAL